MVSSDYLYKMKMVDKATLLLAGARSKAIELAAICKPAILDFVKSPPEQLDLDIAFQDLKRGIETVTSARMAEMKRDYVRSTLGIDWDKFVSLPTTEYADAWHTIRNIHFESELVISAVVHEPLLIHIDRFGKAHWQDQHVAIGSGADVARAMLCLQPWSPISHHQNNDSRGFGRLPIEECIFRIKEAHFAAHKANPSLVGDAFTMQVVMQKYRATLT